MMLTQSLNLVTCILGKDISLWHENDKVKKLRVKYTSSPVILASFGLSLVRFF